ncbi:Cytosine-specific DNA methyltransferase/Type II site-specific deoxyribonuclease [Mycoplasmopsis citelli]|uniref:Cytosine-specific methyltransferase n=1 Tax=Mycoplasmopsis citelli TaxID=171281 RepID=A0A449B1C7_9BACT|nr:DNA cytosine methyltransferase [Mycoplasmopsis citelli]VEU74402.1 Cytosine-specific DNA methyltransferase/Type II site-specific deoxyribonuclease [Mycoplasmopsis citelli]
MKKFKFIDLFAGIGGFRLALEKAGGECVFSCEIDQHAQLIYKENFDEISFEDITKLDASLIPDFDILSAGFPCQAFSSAGHKKGFEDAARGTLFFDIIRILKTKRPKVFILENVKNLINHDKGNTLFVMLKALAEIGYSTNYSVLNAKDFGVPQNRERIVIVGNLSGKIFDFSKLNLNHVSSMEDFLDTQGEFEILSKDQYTLIEHHYVKRQKSDLIFVGYRNKNTRNKGVKVNSKHLSRVHKQPNRIYSTQGVHPTIASQELSGRYFIYDGSQVRKLTINEVYKFMGFPEQFKKVGTNAKLYERIGNSVCVPMIEEIAKQILVQFNQKTQKSVQVNEYLENLYKKSLEIKNVESLSLNNEQMQNIQTIIQKEETFKAVFTVLISSLVYKSLYPHQDIRYHQSNMKNGYSGRSFDTKYITPFLKTKRFTGAMKESGWLTRTLEQNFPYDLNYPGKINNKDVKKSFLEIINNVQNSSEKDLAYRYLLALFKKSLETKNKRTIKLINPIKSESLYTINQIMTLLEKHFYYKYKSRGASILPVVALYSLYECIVKELKRFQNKQLQPLASHNSPDIQSGSTGDIVIKNKSDSQIYESVEVKFDIDINQFTIDDAYQKIAQNKIQRYYILSTKNIDKSQIKQIDLLLQKIKEKHGCQVIVNGVLPTLKYYLRMIKNTDKFIKKYLKNLQNNNEINFEHKLAWNEIIKST